jgi:hypothetical protein
LFDLEEFGVTRPTEPGLANGFITPEEVGEEDLLVFYSAYHGYVDEPAYIHTIADSVRSVTYVHNAGDAFRGSERALFLDAHETRELGDVRFSAVGTMASMASLAYFIEVDGLVVYYQGFGADDLSHYQSELEALGPTRSLDLAFLPIPDDGVAAAEDYLRAFLDRFDPRAVALHTPPHQIGILPDAVELLRAIGFQGEIFLPAHPGDEFLLNG